MLHETYVGSYQLPTYAMQYPEEKRPPSHCDESLTRYLNALFSSLLMLLVITGRLFSFVILVRRSFYIWLPPGR
jgi:hypothetical protein